MIKLSSVVEKAIRAETESAYPDECCGVMLGLLDENGKRVVSEIVPVLNTREDEEKYHRFSIEPDDLMRVELGARKKKLDVLGFYHSHPDHPARPSEFDRTHAVTFYSYVIVSVEKGISKDLTSWELSRDFTQFFSEEVES
jgi:proteasome lid subunit RPN8/RPN11